VQIMKESGNLHPAQLFFKSLSQRTITWSDGKRSMLVTPYVIVLPGKVTGILSVSKNSDRIPEQLCLGIVSKDRVLEIVFQNSRDRQIWSQGLQSLVSGQHAVKDGAVMTNDGSFPLTLNVTTSAAQFYLDEALAPHTNDPDGCHVIPWHEIDDSERRNLQHFYSFFSESWNGAVFQRFVTLKLPQKVVVKLNMNGTALQCIDEDDQNVFEMAFDGEVVIEDSNTNRNDDIFEEKRDDRGLDGRKTKPFRRAPHSMHCFSIIRHDQRLDIGCLDREQYLQWKCGLSYLSLGEMHAIRMKARRAILSGDMYLTADHQLVHSPQLAPANSSSLKPKRKRASLSLSSSKSKSGKSWTSLFG